MNYRLPLDNPAQPDPLDVARDTAVDKQIEKHRAESENKMKTDEQYQEARDLMLQAQEMLQTDSGAVPPRPSDIETLQPFVTLLKARDERDSLRASLQICVGAAGIGDASELCGWIDNAIKVRAERDELNAELVACSEACEAAINERDQLRADNALLRDVARAANDIFQEEPDKKEELRDALTALTEKGIL